MTDAFQILRESLHLGDVPATRDDLATEDRVFRRLARALSSAGDPRRTGPADLAALVRHVLRREENRQGNSDQTLLVPRGTPWWQDGAEWERVGIEAQSAGPNLYRLRALPWRPEWLAGAGSDPPAEDAFAGVPRRTFESVSGDPFLAELGLDEYRCEAQREMVRAVLTASAGSTLVLNLPTGAGKSLCAQLPGLLWSRPAGITVVVVPTTTLALDQARALSHVVPHDAAFHAGGGAAGAVRRAGILRRIEEGKQRIVFCSPESLSGPLGRAVFVAAERGFLKLLAVDEAHVVDEWGSEFRPEFQTLSGYRRSLLRACPGPAFRTLLMTATLTDACLDTLEVLFGGDGPFEVLSAVQLRPEPTYWSCHCPSEEVREHRVLEAVRHLPRPLILYTTRKEDAARWTDLLRADGYARCATVTGDTPVDERERIVGRWREGEIDLVCATSAFGLGMDQAEVRAIVHACVPESADRYYQEVGRAGRDGAACVSLTIYTDGDVGMAADMCQDALITVAKGIGRWRRMFGAAVPLSDGLFRVPVDISPGVDVERVDMRGRLNEAWNVRTLTLMARAGLITLDAESDAEPIGVDTARTRVVRVRDESHLDEATWREKVQPVRQRSYASGAESVSRLRYALSGRRCVADLFAEAYTLRERSPFAPRAEVACCCSGCPRCRAAAAAPRRVPMPLPRPRLGEVRFESSETARLFSTGDTLAIFDLAWDRLELERLARWLLSAGIRHVVIPPTTAPDHRRALDRAVKGTDAPTFVSERFVRWRAPRVPALLFHPPGSVVPSHHLPDAHPGTARFPRVLLLPLDARAPGGAGRTLRDVISCRKYLLDEFLSAFSL